MTTMTLGTSGWNKGCTDTTCLAVIATLDTSYTGYCNNEFSPANVSQLVRRPHFRGEFVLNAHFGPFHK